MAKRERLPQPVGVGEILQKLFKPADMRALELRSRLREAWEAAAGERYRGATRLAHYTHKVLWIEVLSSAWMQELQFEKHRLLRELAARLPPGVVKDLRFSLAAEGSEAWAME